MSVGSAPLITPVANPIANPPRVAVQSRSIPPTTTPTRTTIVSLRAKSGETSGDWTVRMTATAAASTPESSTATPITVSARTPSSRAVRKSAEAARMCRPIVVFPSRSASSPSATAATTTARIVTLRTSTPPIVTTWFSCASETAGSPIVPSRMSRISAMFWSRNATAKVVTSITAGDWVRSGRNTARSIASESAITTTKHATMLAAAGQSEVKASVYAPAMISCPYAKFTSLRTPKTMPIPTAISA